MKFPASSWLLMCLLVSPLLHARDLSVQVHDQDGAPVQDAVITLRPVKATAPSTAVGTDAVAIMDQRGKTFVPHVLVVRPGTRVEFPNSDQIHHHVYSFSPPKSFELKLYSGVEIPSVTFDRPGVVSLGCNIHDWMQGHIYVTDDPLHALTAADGIARFAGLSVGDVEMHIWHPRLRGPYMGETHTLQINAVTPERSEFTVELRTTKPVQQPPSADMDPTYGQRF